MQQRAQLRVLLLQALRLGEEHVDVHQRRTGKQRISARLSLSVVLPRILTDIAVVLSLPRPRILACPWARPCPRSPKRPDPLWDPGEKSWAVGGLIFP